MKKKIVKKILLVWIIFQAQVIYAQFPVEPLINVLNGPAAYSQGAADILSWHANPASLVDFSTINAGLYSEKRFMLRNWQTMQLSIAAPLYKGSAGGMINISRAGGYHATNMFFSYAMKFGEHIDGGAGFIMHQVAINGYGHLVQLSAVAGIRMHLTDQLITGFSLENPSFTKKIENRITELPLRLRVGMGFTASSKCFAGFDIVKSEDDPMQVDVIIRYQPVNALLLHAGISSASNIFSAGACIPWHAIKLDLQVSFHQYLGATPGISIVYNTNAKK
jgi:hypothetical protein